MSMIHPVRSNLQNPARDDAGGDRVLAHHASDNPPMAGGFPRFPSGCPSAAHCQRGAVGRSGCDIATKPLPVGFEASCGEGNADPLGCFSDARGDFDQADLDGFEFGNGERLDLRDGVANLQQQSISAGVQQQSHLIGEP